MTEDFDALVAAAAEYEQEIGEVLSAVSLKAPGVDLGHEVSTVQAARVKFQAALAELSGNVPGEAVEIDAEPEPEPVPAVDVERVATAAEVHAAGLEAGGVDMSPAGETATDAGQGTENTVGNPDVDPSPPAVGDAVVSEGAPATDAAPAEAAPAEEVQPA